VYIFIDLPPEPHTQEVVRKAVAEGVCFAGKPDWAPPGTLELRQGQFTLSELKGWQQQFTPDGVLGTVSWSTIGVNEMMNRIHVRLPDISDEAVIRQRMAETGIPQEAVVFSQGALATFS
jgi:hypothetical protein